jgi:hypothetical protein
LFYKSSVSAGKGNIMKKRKELPNEAVEPDFEVIVRTGEHEAAVIGCFRTGANEWDVVVGIQSTDTRDGIQSALQLAIDAISRTNFMEVRTIPVPGGGGEA